MNRFAARLGALFLLGAAGPAMAFPATVPNANGDAVQVRPVATVGAASTDGSTTQTTGGTAQALFGGATPANGWKVSAPSATAGSFVCWVSDTTTTPGATQAGSYPLYAQGQYGTESGQLPAGPVYVNCPTTGQPISAQKW